jgi:hypothetical protein
MRPLSSREIGGSVDVELAVLTRALDRKTLDSTKEVA